MSKRAKKKWATQYGLALGLLVLALAVKLWAHLVYAYEPPFYVGFFAEVILLLALCIFVRMGRAASLADRRRLESRVAERTEELQHINTALRDEAVGRQRAQVDLEVREKLLRLIANALPVAIAYIDNTERYRFCNQEFCNWFKLSREHIIGHTVREITGADLYEKIHPFIRETLQGETSSRDHLNNYPDRPRNVSAYNIPDKDGQGRVIGYVVLLTDITAHKEEERQLRQAKEEAVAAKEAADAANRAKSVFLANMSHEIRTPLAAVLGFADLLLDARYSPEERNHYIETIRRNGRLLMSLISDLLDLSKVEAGKLKVERTTVHLADLLQEVGTLLEFQAGEKAIKLSLASDGEIPTDVTTDPVRLRQILINIIGNAIKFTERGAVDVTISTREDDGAGLLRFIIKDTGVGINPAGRLRLFEPFTQVDMSTTRRYGGTGLGLALSRLLARSLGGDVRLVTSLPGVGSTFEVTIQVGQMRGRQRYSFNSAAIASPAAKRIRPRIDGMRILLAEDGIDNQVLYTRLLRAAGAQVDVAPNGKEAVERALEQDYDVTLMDLQMPVLDGYGATAELRRRGYRAPILALTAHALAEERERCLANGFNGHISKPINRDALLERLREFAPRLPANVH